MYERELRRFRALVRDRSYIISVHALEEMGEDDLLNEDIEHVVLTGKIVERQLDRASRERKYVFSGTSCDGEKVAVVLKMGPTGKAMVITAYREGEQ
ncbi:MAG: DUF4258 domain-containing protein [Nitrospira sp.]|nr:DUF4258 domain-containing protein [Nitrospira sp.]